MAFDSFADFIAMGNHGFYVWLAYGTAVVALGGLVGLTRWRARRVWQQLADEEID